MIPEFHSAVQFVKDINLEEKLLGMWLSCMATHEELLSAVQNAQSLDGDLMGHYGMLHQQTFRSQFSSLCKGSYRRRLHARGVCIVR